MIKKSNHDFDFKIKIVPISDWDSNPDVAVELNDFKISYDKS